MPLERALVLLGMVLAPGVRTPLGRVPMERVPLVVERVPKDPPRLTVRPPTLLAPVVRDRLLLIPRLGTVDRVLDVPRVAVRPRLVLRLGVLLKLLLGVRLTLRLRVARGAERALLGVRLRVEGARDGRAALRVDRPELAPDRLARRWASASARGNPKARRNARAMKIRWRILRALSRSWVGLDSGMTAGREQPRCLLLGKLLVHDFKELVTFRLPPGARIQRLAPDAVVPPRIQLPCAHSQALV